MNTQDATFNGEQHLSENRQGKRSLQEEGTGQDVAKIGHGVSSSPVDIPHHKTCCCQSCWSKNINSYL